TSTLLAQMDSLAADWVAGNNSSALRECSRWNSWQWQRFLGALRNTNANAAPLYGCGYSEQPSREIAMLWLEFALARKMPGAPEAAVAFLGQSGRKRHVSRVA